MLALSVAGCGSSARHPKRVVPDVAFVAAYTAHAHRRMKTVPLVGYGHEACSDLDAGWTPGQIIEPWTGLDHHDAMLLVTDATVYFCPQDRAASG